MKKISVALLLVLLVLGACLPALAQASNGRLSGQSRGLIRFDAADGEGEEEGEEAQETAEGEEESEQEAQAAEEAEEEGGASVSSQAHPGASHKRSLARLTSLVLTHNGLTAVRQGHPQTSSICFSYKLSAPAKVAAVLSTQSRAAGHAGWHTVSRITLSGRRGSNLAHLSGHIALAAGYDRLTLTPTRGSQRTIAFHVR
ncbi:MAG: hypothetical protein WB698_02450 [Solirubrobacteraceae bacterium]